jgi:aspartate carbamoyltransferase regulatory subunit
VEPTLTETEELRVKKIKEGTVIDHISAGNALTVLNILGITNHTGQVVSVAINVPSSKIGRKDIVKIEGRELNADEVDKIALIAPQATINIIRDFNVIEKQQVKLPKFIREILKCANPTCVSNSREPVEPAFSVENEDPLVLRCHYCGRIMEKQDVLKQFEK